MKRWLNPNPLTALPRERTSTVSEEEFNVQLPALVFATIPADDSRKTLHLSASPEHGNAADEGGPANAAFPAASWFELQLDAGEAELELAILPTRSGDTWSIRRASRNGEPIARAVPARKPAPIQRLIIVFDRTCPDAERWSDARDLVRFGRSNTAAQPAPTGVPEFDARAKQAASAQPAVGAALPQAELNAEIRRGLIEGLKAAFPAPIPLDIVWFADNVEGIYPKDVAIPEVRGWGSATAGSTTAQAQRAISNLTYIPGLDIWDALDDGLNEAARIVTEFGPAAVLIVGNSPPHPPLEPHHPFTRLWREQLPPSAARSRGSFPAQLAKLEKLRCPVAMLFLTGHTTTGEGDDFHSNQHLVQSAFNRVMLIESFHAAAPEVAAGVVSVAAKLKDWMSAVDLRTEED